MSLKPVSNEERAEWERVAKLILSSDTPFRRNAERTLRLLADLEREENWLVHNCGFRVSPLGYIWNGKDSDVFDWPHAHEPNVAEAIYAISEQEQSDAE